MFFCVESEDFIMNVNLKEKQKKEAVKRMKILNIFGQTIKEFEIWKMSEKMMARSVS